MAFRRYARGVSRTWTLPVIGLRRVARRRLLVLLAVPLVVVASAVSDLRATTPLYRAEAELLIAPSLAELLFDPLRGRLSRARTVNNAVRVVNSPQVAELAAARLGFSGGISASTDEGSDAVTLTAVDTDPVRAARVATAFGEAYLVHRRALDVRANETIQAELNRQLAIEGTKLEALDAELHDAAPALRAALIAEQAPQRGGISYAMDGLREQLRQVASAVNVDRGGATLTRQAEVPRDPLEPQADRSIGLAALSGLLLASGLALVLDALDRRVHSAAAAADAAGIPVLAEMGRDGQGKGYRTSDVEALRHLRTVLASATAGRRGRVVAVYGTHHGAGTTATTAGLASALAATGNRVIALDANFHRPRLHRALGLDGRFGLTSVLLRQVELKEALQRSPRQSGLHLLATGPITPSAPELLSGRAFASLLDETRELADVVVLDCPPARTIDAYGLLAAVDFEVLVVELERTTRPQITEIAAAARRNPASVLVGMVVRGPRRSSVVARRGTRDPADSTARPVVER